MDKPVSSAPVRAVFTSKRTNPVRRWFAWLSHEFKHARGTMQTPWQRLLAHVEAIFIDHAMFRLAYPNRHAISERMWRSSQPTPRQIAQLARKGIRTIVNLRGARDCASYHLEKEACERNGIRLIDFPVNSRQPPTREIIASLQTLFENIEYPALMHCKAGSDRVGMMSALYLLVAEKKEVETALKQLSPLYGHVRQSKAGVLDHFLETYRDFSKQKPVPFLDWAHLYYNRDEVIATHKVSGWAEWLYNGLLKRE